MDTTLILSNIAKHIILTEQEKEYFVSQLQHKTLKRKQFLLKQGEFCTDTAFVVKGCLKGYTIDKNGEEHMINFALADWWIGDIYSLLSRKPAILNIEAAEETEVLLLSKKNQDELYHHVPKFERFFRLLIENSLVANQQRIINNLSLTAEERYRDFVRKYPLMLEHVSQQNIASYLGVTPEFLSKIRGRIAKEKVSTH